ncbi:MAG: rod shape-determining protein MreC [Patescibacteria group bacterium]|jgi:rod shape-determining protein MreC|nr:rod shape-determining protein MreC [Patescibacteria group bacterium]
MRKYFIFVIFLFFIIFLLKGENLFYIILKPEQKLLYQSNRGEIEDDFCRQIKIENVQLKNTQLENEILREYLDFLTKSKDKFIMANVIGRRTESGITWFLLDRGEKQGLRSGLAVLDENGVLIGIINKVEKEVSYFHPIFDQHLSIAADIISQEFLTDIGSSKKNEKSETISGIIQGEYGLNLKMKYVPLDKEIKIGDGVITSGQDNIRWGIIIGQVAEIDKKPNAIFQEILIRPLFQTDFKIVSVILPF